jgi:hypothetical protein
MESARHNVHGVRGMKRCGVYGLLVMLLGGCVSALPEVSVGHPAHVETPAGQQFEPSRLLSTQGQPVMDPLLPPGSAGHLEHEHAQGAPPGEDGQPDDVLYTCPMHPEIVQQGPGKCPKCGMALVRQQEERVNADAPAAPAEDTSGAQATAPAEQDILYTCPMHPEVVQKGPGTCSKCGGMKLVPKEQ